MKGELELIRAKLFLHWAANVFTWKYKKVICCKSSNNEPMLWKKMLYLKITGETESVQAV